MIIACPWEQWLRECTSVLCHTYIACLELYIEAIQMFWQTVQLPSSG
jgi:hypothetical protein